jgi:hypothetical protein
MLISQDEKNKNKAHLDFQAGFLKTTVKTGRDERI